MPPSVHIALVFLILLASLSVCPVKGAAEAISSGEPKETAGSDGPVESQGQVEATSPEGGTPAVTGDIPPSEEPIGSPDAGNPVGGSWLDRYRQSFKGQVDRSADWVDGLLGSNVEGDEPENASGRVSGNVYWQNREGFDFGGRFRIKVSLDNTNNRFNAILGRGTPEELVENVYSPTSKFASFYLGGRSEDLVAGVNYKADSSRSGNLSLGGGIHLSSSPAPYVNINYNYLYRPDDSDYQFGVYQTFYYRTDEGFGSRTTFQPEWLVSDDWLIQWYTVVEVGEEPLGVLWQSYLTVYQDLKKNRAIAYGFAAVGETDRDIPVVNYGLTVTYRQRVFRDWLFGEVTLGVAFPREYPEYERRGNPLIGFGLEFFFGDGR